VSDRPRGRPQAHRGPLRAQARESRTSTRRIRLDCLHAQGENSGGQRFDGAVGPDNGGLVIGTVVGSTPATVLVSARYPGSLPG
jgi:hypothetical protein